MLKHVVADYSQVAELVMYCSDHPTAVFSEYTMSHCFQMMKMYFHTGDEETILFKEWTTGSYLFCMSDFRLVLRSPCRYSAKILSSVVGTRPYWADYS